MPFLDSLTRNLRPLGTAIDYLTPGMGSNRLTDYGVKPSGGGGGGGGWGPGGGVPSRPLPGLGQNPYQPSPAATQWADQRSQIQSLLASLRPVAPAKVDIAAINAQARQQAEQAVNPLYTKKLNDMLARQAVKRARAQQDYSTAVQDIDEALKQTQEGNQLERGRTAEDVATATGEINTAEDRFQTASGQAFDDARLAEASELAAAGLTTSGIGRQRAQRTIEQQNLTEKQQGEEFQAQRTSQAVLKARTFEDLARSDVMAAGSAEKGRQRQKINLDRLIEDIGVEEEQEKFGIEEERLSSLSEQTRGYGKNIFNQYLASIRDPRLLAATAQAYGGLF